MTKEFQLQIDNLISKYGQFNKSDIEDICIWMQKEGYQHLSLVEGYERMMEK